MEQDLKAQLRKEDFFSSFARVQLAPLSLSGKLATGSTRLALAGVSSPEQAVAELLLEGFWFIKVL